MREAAMKKVVIDRKSFVLDDFFKVEEAHLQYERFNGEMSRPVRRFSLERGNSVAVLVHNLDTQKIILIDQFRYPTYKNGHGWLTEIIAGMVDEGGTPEESARRELLEEAGLTISAFEHIFDFYPSPGGSSEIVFLYYAEVSGKNAVYSKTGGLSNHGEDIVSLEFTLEEALNKIRTGEIMDAKTIIAILWLENRLLERSKKAFTS
jgi:nudix-type nucleoside diphosphatase (YffH/AdpP family)